MNKHPGKIALKIQTLSIPPSKGAVVAPPSSGSKRKERPVDDDDDASVRRVSQRTDTPRPEDVEAFIRATVNHDLRSDDEDVSTGIEAWRGVDLYTRIHVKHNKSPSERCPKDCSWNASHPLNHYPSLVTRFSSMHWLQW